ncbi:pantoate--beta-alanine ligase [Flavobacterium croceum]|uniref:pantoate--beta-alanine ligase n=1 Tax=Flavobacterium croceum TaxID=370975 RepID=UPI0024A8BB3D|nr:pantoate--beta-alanine ligase [Flavobacterium croceum]
MLVFNKKELLRDEIEALKTPKSSVGFVPTMGALHQGHLSLLEKSVAENSITVISIFVNPTQFNNAEDLKKYPKTLEADLEKIKTVSENILVYAPTVDDIYEGNTVSEHFSFDGLEHKMEGKFRPGHFDGVGTVVKKLFEIVQPNHAYFGEKDFQQLQIVKKLVQKQNLPVNIVACPIYREANGLAMSSRNQRLSEEEKNKAGIIYKTLMQAKKMFGTKSAQEVSKWVTNQLKKQNTFELEYFEIASEDNLKTCKRKSKNKNYRAFIAVFVNKIRLIDTISLK